MKKDGKRRRPGALRLAVELYGGPYDGLQVSMGGDADLLRLRVRPLGWARYRWTGRTGTDGRWVMEFLEMEKS